jgi:hypothetical protein
MLTLDELWWISPQSAAKCRQSSEPGPIAPDPRYRYAELLDLPLPKLTAGQTDKSRLGAAITQTSENVIQLPLSAALPKRSSHEAYFQLGQVTHRV